MARLTDKEIKKQAAIQRKNEKAEKLAQKEKLANEKAIGQEKERLQKEDKLHEKWLKKGMKDRLKGMTKEVWMANSIRKEAEGFEKTEESRHKSRVKNLKTEGGLQSLNVTYEQEIHQARLSGDADREKMMEGLRSKNDEVTEQLKNIGTEEYKQVDFSDELKGLDTEILDLKKEILEVEEDDPAYKQLENSIKLKEEEKEGLGISQDRANMMAQENAMMGEGLGFLTDMKSKAEGFAKFMGNANVVMMMSMVALAALAKLMFDIASKAKEIRQTTGHSLSNSIKMSAAAKDMSMQYGMFGVSADDALEAITATADAMGGVSEASLEAAGHAAKLQAQYGIAVKDSAVLMTQMKALGGLTAEASEDMIAMTSAMAQSAGVSPAEVMGDVAKNTEFFAKHGKDGGKNIMKAAIAAKKLGLELSDISAMTDSIMDIESSIAKEMEASVLLGRSVNMNKARELTMAGDMVGAQKEILKQVGGQAEFDKMNYYQKQALADSIGVGVDKLGSMIANQEELNNMTWVEKKQMDAWAATTEFLGKAWGYLKTVALALMIPLAFLYLPTILPMMWGMVTATWGLVSSSVAAAAVKWAEVAAWVGSIFTINAATISAIAFWAAATLGISLIIMAVIGLIAYFDEILEWFESSGPIVKAAILMILGPIAMLAYAAYWVYDNWEWIMEQLDLAWQGLVNLFKMTKDAIVSYLTFPFKMLKKAYDFILGALKGAWEGLVNLFKRTKDLIVSFITFPFVMLKKVYDYTLGVLGKAWEGLVKMFKWTKDKIVYFVTYPFVMLKKAYDYAIDKLKNAWGGVTDFFGSVWGGVSSVTSSIWNGITGFLGGVWDGLSGAASATWGAIKDGVGAAWDWVSTKTADTWGGITEFLSGAWTSIKDTGAEVWEGMGEKLSGMKDTIGAAWEGISSKVGNIAGALRDKVNEAMSGVGDFFGGVWDSLKEKAAAIFTSIGTFVTDAWDSTKDTVAGAWDSIASYISNIGGSILTALKAPFIAAWDFITGLFDFGSIFAGVRDTMYEYLPDWIVDAFFSITDAVGLTGGDGEESADDIAMGPGPGKVITSPAGTYKLNPMDSVVAGTEVGGEGGDQAAAGSPELMNKALLAKLDQLIAVASKGGTVTLDGKRVGDILSKGISHPVRG